MRETLIKIISHFKLVQQIGVALSTEEAYAQLADHLISNGVIVPPCKIGDTVYMPWEWNGQKGVACLKVNFMGFITTWECGTDFESDDIGYIKKYHGGYFNFNDFGKTVFLTREEAEKALKGDGDNGL